VRILLKRSLASNDRKFGTLYYPDNIFLYNFAVDLSSNGRLPQSIANRITPQDHISTISA